MIILFIRHKDNIKRLIHHQENIVPFGLWYWYKKAHHDLPKKNQTQK